MIQQVMRFIAFIAFIACAFNVDPGNGKYFISSLYIHIKKYFIISSLPLPLPPPPSHSLYHAK